MAESLTYRLAEHERSTDCLPGENKSFLKKLSMVPLRFAFAPASTTERVTRPADRILPPDSGNRVSGVAGFAGVTVVVAIVR